MPTGDDIIANVALGGAPGRGTSDYTLTVEQASELFALGGVPRSIRSVQRFCRKGHLDAITLDTDRGKISDVASPKFQTRCSKAARFLPARNSRTQCCSNTHGRMTSVSPAKIGSRRIWA